MIPGSMEARVSAPATGTKRPTRLTAAACLAALVAGSALAWADEPRLSVAFPSEGRTLKGWVYRPAGADAKGRFPAVIWNHGSNPMVNPPEPLARLYTDHGFVVFYPVRRYHEPSSPGPSIVDLIAGASDRAQAWIRYNEEENRDVFGALDWLKTQPYVDPDRIIVSGVSFGGVQTLLAAEKGGGFRLGVAFAPGAMSWKEGRGPIPERLEKAVKNRKIPVFILQASNDYSLGPVSVLGPLLDRSKLLHRVKQYPDFGARTPGMPDESWHQLGHGAFAIRGGDVWGADVFAFIDEVISDRPPARPGR
jgi:dienelactone hydrolase